MKYVPLYIKTENTLLKSMIRIPSLITYAKEHNLTALSITDSSMFGVMEFYKACIEANIRPVIGLEIVLEDTPIILYCKNYIGYKNLIKLSTIQSERSLMTSDLQIYNDELICILPYLSKEKGKVLKSIYSSLYFGYQNKEEYTIYIESALSNIVYMNEVLYMKEEDRKYYSYLTAIREGKLVSDCPVIEGVHHLVLPEDIHYEINKNREIYEACDIKIEREPDLLPKYPCPDNYDSYSYLRHLCKVGLKKRFGETVPKKYIERLNYELDIIKKMGFCNYFLVVWDYVTYAKEHNILVGPGRGSAAGSLVSYCLFITEIDPIAYNLLFERFLNPERITMPDIDMDFEDTARDQVVSYCMEKYGKKRVVEIITFGTLGAKQVIRDVARCMNISLEQVDFLCKLLDAKLSLQENYRSNDKIRRVLEGNTKLQTLYKVSIKLEGLKRHTSIHAAGVVMSSLDIDEVIPLYKHDDVYLTGYSMDYLEELGLLKMDFLSITTLGTIASIIKEIQNDGIAISFDTIPFEDKKALSIFHDVNTIGIFQFESAGMMNFLRKFKPDSFEDIFAALALYRPGPMGNIDTYIKRKQGKEKIDYFHPDLEPILKPTYGILIYQEQIMQVASVLAGYSLGEADVLRRAMSKKKESVLLQEKEKFVHRAISRGYEESLASKVYELILKFASYGFNRSHSVAYAVVSYKMAYLKAHYPLYFMKSMLTMAIGSTSNTKKYIYECKGNQVQIVKPDINESFAQYQLTSNGILYPLTNIKNVGENSAKQIIEEREKGNFTSIYDFVQRVYGKAMNRKTFTSLIYAGCFDAFSFNHKTLIENIDVIINYGEIIQDLDPEFALEPELVMHEEYSSQELMQQELEVFGFYLSNHPVTEFKTKYSDIVLLQDLNSYFDKVIHTIVYVDHMRSVATKKNDMMCFLTCSDELMRVDAVLFPNIYEKVKDILSQDIVISIVAKVEKRFDKLQLVVQKLEILK